MATINLGSIKFNWKGAFNNSTAYAVDDVVSSGGSSYVCIQASQGNAVGDATAYWNIMSKTGTNGTDLTSTLTTRGDIVFRNASALARLAKGTAGQVLGQGANDPAWVNGSSSTLTTQGDLLFRDGSGLQRLAKGTAAQELRMNSSANAPEWYTPVAGGNTPAFQAKKSSNQTASDDVWTLVTLDTEIYDSDNKFANNRFTPNVAGYYNCFGAVFVDGASDTLNKQSISIYKNGGQLLNHWWDDDGDQIDKQSMYVTGIIYLDSNDYIEMYAAVDTGSGSAIFKGLSNATLETHMGAFKIG